MQPKMKSLNIALIHELRSSYLDTTPGHSEEHCAALPHEGEVQAVETTLKALGHNVTLVSGIEALVAQLADNKHSTWDLAFNMAQGFYGSTRESQVPALLEAYRIPYTFSDAATMASCQNKATSKIILRHHGIPTAPFLVVSTNEIGDQARITLPDLSSSSIPSYPLFLKPTTEGSSKGIDQASKIRSPKDLDPGVRALAAKFPGQDILVEPFLSGREFTVSIMGTGPSSRVIGVAEHPWKHMPKAEDLTAIISKDVGAGGTTGQEEMEFASQVSKSCSGDTPLTCVIWPLDATDKSVKAAGQVALDSWNVFGCRDAGRVDIRFDNDGPDGVPNVLEINPISGLLPEHSPLPSGAAANGISYKDLLSGIIESAYERVHV